MKIDYLVATNQLTDKHMTILLYILAAIVVLVLVLALVAPKSYDVFRTVDIDKPKQRVFEYLRFLKNQDEWSPWAKKDPNMVKKFTGTDGEVGCVSYWKGNKEVGEGEQEITKIIPEKRVDSELRFLKPWKSTSESYLFVDDGVRGKTKVTWGLSGKNKFPMSVMTLFMSMDKMVGKDFEEGLATLKTRLENESV
jgi:hypothetical protein